MRRIGFVLNPLAGLGGPAGLKGTDGPGTAGLARARGAQPMAQERAQAALAAFAAAGGNALLLTAAGEMGADAAQAAGLPHEIVHAAPPGISQASDTRATADAAVRHGAGAILFGGGDGTARDVLDAAGGGMPLLGIPCGVKMQSGLFATGPVTAGRLLAGWLDAAGPRATRQAEVMDIDEEALRAGSIAPRLYGYATVPDLAAGLQHPKAGRPRKDDAAIAAAGREVAARFPPGTAVIVGPGTAAKAVCAALGLEGTLLGVDVLLDGRLVARDVSRAGLVASVGDRPLRIVLGVTGGQGFVLGRGNQPIGPDIVRRAGRAGLTILAGRGKLAMLPRPLLLVDTGDADLDATLTGHVRVHTGPGEVCIMRLAAA